MKIDILQILGNLLLLFFIAFFAFTIIQAIYIYVEHIRKEKIDFIHGMEKFK